jgi:hypothetical protein
MLVNDILLPKFTYHYIRYEIEIFSVLPVKKLINKASEPARPFSDALALRPIKFLPPNPNSVQEHTGDATTLPTNTHSYPLLLISLLTLKKGMVTLAILKILNKPSFLPRSKSQLPRISHPRGL